MPRSKEYRASSSLRHLGKLYRVFGKDIPPEIVAQIAQSSNSEWNNKFGLYHNMWITIKEALVKQFPDIARGQYGLLRSYMLKALKSKKQGMDLDKLADEYAKITKLPVEYLRFINDQITAITI